MGLIGWADAPNTIENEAQAVAVTASEPVPTPEKPEEIQAEPEAVSEAESAIEEEPPSYIEEVSVENLANDFDDTDDSFVSVESINEGREAFGIQLFNAIAKLRLLGDDASGKYDISKFELHEIEFLFEHAERCGFDDYFGAVRSVFGVKHRILDDKGDIDSISSPNLDELLAFVEEKYEKSFGGETE